MEKERLPIFYLYKRVVFPHCTTLFKINEKQFPDLESGEKVLAFPTRGIIDTLLCRFRIATLSEIGSIEKDGKHLQIQLKGVIRTRIRNISRFRDAKYEIVDESETSNDELIESLRKRAQELIFLINVNESDKLIHLLNFLNDLSQLTDFIANYFIVDFPGRYSIFNEMKIEKRASKLIVILDTNIELIRRKQEKRVE